MKQISVVAAIIRSSQGFFVTKRGYGPHKGGWEFPGGKVEAGETKEEALCREIMEELDTKIQVDQFLCTVEHEDSEVQFEMDCFYCSVISGNLVLKEHEEGKWVALEELEKVDFLPADVKVLEKIIEDSTVSVDVMRRSDAYTIANLTDSKTLMYRAGKGIFEAVDWEAPVAIVAGKGNNGGDGFVVATLLKRQGIGCEIICLSDTFSEDGAFYFKECEELGIPCFSYAADMDFSKYGTLVDCLFGTGFSGIPRAPYASAIEKINTSGAYVVSADINSGLNGDTGEGSCFVHSDLTVSIGSYKRGHFFGKAKEAMKTKVNVDIGIQIIE